MFWFLGRGMCTVGHRAGTVHNIWLLLGAWTLFNAANNGLSLNFSLNFFCYLTRAGKWELILGSHQSPTQLVHEYCLSHSPLPTEGKSAHLRPHTLGPGWLQSFRSKGRGKKAAAQLVKFTETQQRNSPPLPSYEKLHFQLVKSIWSHSQSVPYFLFFIGHAMQFAGS